MVRLWHVLALTQSDNAKKPLKRKPCHGFVQLDVCAAITTATAVLVTDLAAQTPIG